MKSKLILLSLLLLSLSACESLKKIGQVNPQWMHGIGGIVDKSNTQP